MAETEDPRVRVETYLVVPTGYDEMVNSDRSIWALRVSDGGSAFGWKVSNGASVMGRDGEWEYEPQPSSRTDEWLAEHRFPRDEALALALSLVDGIRRNGFTAQEASDRVAARLAATS